MNRPIRGRNGEEADDSLGLGQVRAPEEIARKLFSQAKPPDPSIRQQKKHGS